MNKRQIPPPVQELPSYFTYWGDIFLSPIASKVLLPIAVRIPWLTPNMVTIGGFMLYVLSCIFLFLPFSNHLIWAACLLPLSYILDCLDGQLARRTKQFSPIGDYLDKTLDVLKVYVLTLSLGYAVFLSSGNFFSLILALTACFFFNYRYYIKLETVLTASLRDEKYLQKCSDYKKEQFIIIKNKLDEYKKTPLGYLYYLWYRNRLIFFVDEAELVIFTSLGAFFNHLDITLWVLAISQLVVAVARFFERGYQVKINSTSLIKPMRR